MTMKGRTNQPQEICIIAPTETLAATAREVVDKAQDNIGIYVAAMEEAAQVAKKLTAQGTKIIISRKGTKALLEKVCNAKVVAIENSLEDYVTVLEKLHHMKEKIGFLNYGSIPTDVVTLCNMLNMSFGSYNFTGIKDSEACVRRALDDGVTIAIGGVTTELYANAVGMRHITIENSQNAVIAAINVAKQILATQKEEEKKQEELSIQLKRYELIFDYTHDAIVAIDQTGRIEAINAMAERIISGDRQQSFIGKDIGSVLQHSQMLKVLHTGEAELDRLMTIRNAKISINQVPIVVGGTVHGVVATFQDVNRLQDSEQKIRLQMSDKGHLAKHYFSDIVGKSESIKTAKYIAEGYAKSDATVLIQGETGTGKELFAQSIHNASRRCKKQFVAINCAALPQNLLEAELFGYESGAFTGASKGGKAGLFELAHGGSIFLDEIGELTMETQVQLLRVLQEKEIRRIGSERITPVDIRVITATNRNLEEAVAKGQFRQDLFYRLNVLAIHIPPLRERREDIPLLGRDLFLQQKDVGVGTRMKEFLNILGRLDAYPWYGNVRELRNFVERVSALMAIGAGAEQFDSLIREYTIVNDGLREKQQEPKTDGAAESLREWDRRKIVQALKENNLIIEKTASALGVSRTTLWRKMKEYGIKRL